VAGVPPPTLRVPLPPPLAGFQSLRVAEEPEATYATSGRSMLSGMPKHRHQPGKMQRVVKEEKPAADKRNGPAAGNPAARHLEGLHDVKRMRGHGRHLRTGEASVCEVSSLACSIIA
jgi:hypothetical protein